MFDLLSKDAFLDRTRKIYQNSDWEGNYTRQTTDERRVLSTKGVTNLKVNANLANVRIHVIQGASDEIVVHLHGEAIAEGNINLKANLNRDKKEADISFEFSGCFYHGKHTLDICVPDRSFYLLDVTTTQGNVFLGCGESEILNVFTEAGKVSSDWNYQNGDVITSSANIIISSRKVPKSLNVASTSGDVYVTFPKEVGFSLNPKSRVRQLKKANHLNNKFNVEFFVTTSGSVRVS